MNPIRLTLFVTGAILVSMFLAAMKVQAQVPYTECSSSAKPLYLDIQIYNETKKISEQHALIGTTLKQELSMLNMKYFTLDEKVQALETSFARCYVDLDQNDEMKIQMEIESLKKLLNPLEIE